VSSSSSSSFPDIPGKVDFGRWNSKRRRRLRLRLRLRRRRRIRDAEVANIIDAQPNTTSIQCIPQAIHQLSFRTGDAMSGSAQQTSQFRYRQRIVRAIQ
jgi:hypothetical protein